MTPEAKVKKVVISKLYAAKAYYFSPITGGYGKSGVPDIVGCLRGYFFGIECKAGNKVLCTPLQEKNLQDIKKAGGISLVINEKNMEDTVNLIWREVEKQNQLLYPKG